MFEISIGKMLKDNINLKEIPETIGNAHNLKKLHLNHNKLKSLPDTMESLQELQTLLLDHNKFEEFPSVIFKLRSLEILTIHMNSIKTVPDSFHELQSLKYIYLNRNKLQMLPESLFNSNSIETLNLSFNKIPSFPENINVNTTLEKILCDYNKINEISKKFYENLKNLKVLHIDGNPINLIPPGFGLHNPRLRNLSIDPRYMDSWGRERIKFITLNSTTFVSTHPYSITFVFAHHPQGFNQSFVSRDQQTGKKFSKNIRPISLPFSTEMVIRIEQFWDEFLSVINIKRAYNKKWEYKRGIAKLIKERQNLFVEVKKQLGSNFIVEDGGSGFPDL